MSSAINTFLADCAKTLLSRPFRSGTCFVLGNEGGDADSILGALLLAYCMASSRGGYVAGSPSPVIPLLNFPHEDLPLRGDVQKLLKERQIDVDLLCSCERGMSGPSSAANYLNVYDPAFLAEEVQFLLFDHNALCPRQEHLAGKVVGSVDHHADEQKYLENGLDKCPFHVRIVEKVGSASSHVALMYQQCGVEVPDAKLLFAPIVLDTYNFDKKMDRVTEKDEAAAALLLPKILSDDKDFSQEAFYETLKKNKFDVSELTIPQSLRRDYKQFPMKNKGNALQCVIGISSMLESAQTVLDRFGEAELSNEFETYCQRNKLDVLLLMFVVSVGDSFERELLVYLPEATVKESDGERSAKNKQLMNGLVANLPSAELTSMPGVASTSIVLYKQGNVSMSRKTLTPELAKYVASAE